MRRSGQRGWVCGVRERERDRERSRRRSGDPAYQALERERKRIRRSDPEYRERERALDRERKRRRRSDPAYRERELERQRKRYTTPEYRERRKERYYRLRDAGLCANCRQPRLSEAYCWGCLTKRRGGKLEPWPDDLLWRVDMLAEAQQGRIDASAVRSSQTRRRARGPSGDPRVRGAIRPEDV